MRIHTNEILEKVGETVLLSGWVHARRDHGKLIFIDLRDRWGLVQVVFSPVPQELLIQADRLRPEWVISVEGTVKERPKGMQNNDIPTGNLEIEALHLEILNEANTPPFALDTLGYEIGEEHRMKYRYLDLRRARMKKNLLMRDRIIAYIRTYLHVREFIEIETPVLTKSTPEGARDYVVPSRLYPGKFYALPQSPQQYKQLLMVAGIERYFQIARCFRDEDTRGDRQPEFTQLDLEMSFVQEDDILNLIEQMYIELVEKLYPEKKILQKPFPRIEYADAMTHYGTDKPDIRKNKDDPHELAFAFVVNFPMFEWKKEEKRWDAVHHPFTKIRNEQEMPTQSFIEHIKKNPQQLMAHQYDVVLNGYEIGGGSIREHNSDILTTVFEIMGNTREAIETKFRHILEAFGYGVPPHGGIAPGIDRLIMLLEGEPNIREVIAFPKTGDGRDLMMDAPAEIESSQLKELHIQVRKE